MYASTNYDNRTVNTNNRHDTGPISIQHSPNWMMELATGVSHSSEVEHTKWWTGRSQVRFLLATLHSLSLKSPSDLELLSVKCFVPEKGCTVLVQRYDGNLALGDCQLFLSWCRWSRTVYNPFSVTKQKHIALLKAFSFAVEVFSARWNITISSIENMEKRTTVKIVFIHEKHTQVLYTSFTKKLTIFYLPKLCSSLKLSSSCTRSTSVCEVKYKWKLVIKGKNDNFHYTMNLFVYKHLHAIKYIQDTGKLTLGNIFPLSSN